MFKYLAIKSTNILKLKEIQRKKNELKIKLDQPKNFGN